MVLNILIIKIPWRVRDHETGLSGRKCTFFPTSNIYIYIYIYILVFVFFCFCFCFCFFFFLTIQSQAAFVNCLYVARFTIKHSTTQIKFPLLLLWWWWWLQVIPVKMNYKYFTLYKAWSLNLKIIWSKRVSFFVFLRCSKLIRRSHGSRSSVIGRSDAICFYWNEWMKIDCSFWYTNHVQWHTNHVKEKVKSTITADS